MQYWKSEIIRFKEYLEKKFKFDRSKVPAEIDALTAKVKEEYAAGKNEGKKHRILITGCPMGGATMKVVKALKKTAVWLLLLKTVPVQRVWTD